MLQRIIAIKGVGRFRNCGAAGDVTFRRYTLIFAENGRGKTTLCAILRSLFTKAPALVLGRATLADEIPMSLGTNFVMSRSDGAPMQTWTLAGTRANRTLARQASIGTAKVRFEAFIVQAPVDALGASYLQESI